MTDDPKFNARNSDPHTSHEAAESDEQKRRDKATVWATFVKEKRPLADFMLEELLGGANNGKWRKRRSDLTRERSLVAVGEVTNLKTRRKQLLWAISRKGDQERPQPVKPQMDLAL